MLKIEVTGMFLKKLSDEEIKLIKKAKDAANKGIKEKRKRLLLVLKACKKSNAYQRDTLKHLERQLDACSIIVGLPVILSDDGESIILDYNLLKKLDSSLKRSQFDYVLPRVSVIHGKKYCTVHYRNQFRQGVEGRIELLELPENQVEALIDLPVIDLGVSV